MEAYFYAKLDDLVRRAVRGDIASGNFLNPAESYAAKIYLNSVHRGMNFMLWGGYNAAERTICVVFPEWMSYADQAEMTSSANNFISAVHIAASGYASLTHRDYLGALIGLGIERECIGDIAVTDGENCGAVVFCTENIGDFLLGTENPLTGVGHDKVKVGKIEISQNFDGGRQFQKITGTAASLRLDSVVSVLVGMSREKVKDIIKAGDVALNFSETDMCDHEIKTGDIISVHGYGRFRMDEAGGKTKKDRLRINAVKYV